MRKQDYLLQLIQCLSPNERRYFKLFSNIQPGEKSYLRLFDALENKAEYNADELSKELDISVKQLSDDKFYLNQVLLSSLCNFDREHHALTNLHNSLTEVRSLLHRRLYDFALAQTEKVFKRAVDLELYTFLPEILGVKQTCLRRLSQFEELKKLDKEHDIIIERNKEMFEMIQLSYTLTHYEQKREKPEKVKHLFANPLMKNRPKGLRSFLIWFSLKGYEEILTKKDPLAWAKFVRSSVKYCEKNPQLMAINPLACLYMYTDLISAEMGIDNYSGAIKVHEQLALRMEKPVAGISKEELESARLFALYLKAYALRKRKLYPEARLVAQKIYECKNLRPVYDQYSFTFEYAVDLLHCGETETAIQIINELLQSNADVRRDYQQFVRILLIMAQIDIGNYAFLPYLVKSGKIWLKRRKEINEEMMLFFSWTLRLSKTWDTRPRKELFSALKQTLAEGKLTELDDINLTGWVDKHLK